MGEAVSDIGAYGEVKNLTDMTELAREGDIIAFNAPGGAFYYQGKLREQALPWVFDIAYTLNGKATLPQALSGASGVVGIQIATRKNPAVNPIFFDNYALQMTVTLSTEKCQNIQAPGATAANAGTNRVLTYTALAGGEKTWEITFDAADFEMDAIAVNGIPLNLDIGEIDTASVKDQVKTLQDAMDTLEKGSGDLNKAAGQIKSGAQTLYDSSALVAEGVGKLKTGSDQLAQGSALMKSSLEALDKQLSASVPGNPSDIPKGYAEVKKALGQIQTGAASLQSGSAAYKKGLAALAAQADHSADIALLSKALSAVEGSSYAGKFSEYTQAGRRVLGALTAQDQAIKDLSESYDALDAGIAALSDLPGTLDTLERRMTALNAALDTYMSAGPGAIGAAKSAVNQMASLYPQLDDGIGALRAGLSTLDTRYGALHAGIGALSSGAKKLKSGTGKLDKGAGEMAAETGDMDQKIDEEIENITSRYDKGDFAPVSFVDSRNAVTSVQFVLRTDAIEKPEAAQVATTEKAETSTLWARIAKLFER